MRVDISVRSGASEGVRTTVDGVEVATGGDGTGPDEGPVDAGPVDDALVEEIEAVRAAELATTGDDGASATGSDDGASATGGDDVDAGAAPERLP
ncbi:hypothetical protein [Isoptericola aurantiacus]|uniref:hypothetical protein n=1 Tax=Isoptericola aurantiacus TaxID=3377839 RepID=UPI003839F0D8